MYLSQVMGSSTSKKKEPSYTFQLQALRGLGSRLNSFCKEQMGDFYVGNKSVFSTAKSYLAGLLTKANRKNIERMEEYVHDCEYEATQHFISESPWDHKRFISHVACDVSKEIGGPKSVLAIDESAFGKKGNKSVGVSRQYNGRLGKVDNCQVGVFGALTDGEYVSLIDARLYLPQEWIDSPSRCNEAKIPEHERVFKTKWEIGLDIVDTAVKNNVSFSFVDFDGFYGNIPEFTTGLSSRGLLYIGAVHKDQTIFDKSPEPYLPRRTENVGRKYTRYRTKIAGMEVQKFNEQLTTSWKLVTIRRGTKGYVSYFARRARVWLWEEHSPNQKEVWLIILKDPVSNEIKYFLSNTDKSYSLKNLVRKAACRFYIERAFQDAKTSLGMADYQVRIWNGWNHHMAMVLLAMQFILKEKKRNSSAVPLLSFQDVVELLSYYLPKGGASEEEIFEQLVKRHEKRQKATESAFRKQAEKYPDMKFNLTK